MLLATLQLPRRSHSLIQGCTTFYCPCSFVHPLYIARTLTSDLSDIDDHLSNVCAGGIVS